jgi:coenzyme F420-reducing hydrogenase delta subunit
MKLLKKLLEDMAVDPGRVRFEYISASEGAKFASVATEFVDQLKKMGPNPLKEGKA